MDTEREFPSPITLEQFSRLLAVHALLVAYPGELHSFFAPEQGERLAEFIYRFANGEPVGRPLECEAD